MARKFIMDENPNIGCVIKTTNGEIREITDFQALRDCPYETKKGSEIMWIEINDIDEIIVESCSSNKVQDLLIYFTESQRAGLLF
jgi:hypothetical protein